MITSTGNYSTSNLFANPLLGMRKAVEQANDASEKIADGDISPENIVSGMEAQIQMKANVATLRVADSLIGTLLDRRA